MSDSGIGMTSLKDIAAEVVAHHDLLDGHKRGDHGTSSDQALNMRRMWTLYMYL